MLRNGANPYLILNRGLNICIILTFKTTYSYIDCSSPVNRINDSLAVSNK